MRSVTSNLLPIEMSVWASSFPCLTQSLAHPDCSPDYRHVSTLAVIDQLAEQGFRPYHIGVTRTLKRENAPYAKHLIRFRHDDDAQALQGVGDAAPEIVVINSHNAGSSWKIMLGIFVLACSNGLVLGEKFQTITVRHAGNNVPDKVAQAVTRVYSQRETIGDKMRAMRATTLTTPEYRSFAQNALLIRRPELDAIAYPDKVILMQKCIERLTRVRRHIDYGFTLWQAYNVLQENLLDPIKVPGLRRVTAIEETVRINRKLADLADTFIR